MNGGPLVRMIDKFMISKRLDDCEQDLCFSLVKCLICKGNKYKKQGIGNYSNFH
jgi:hypothetical protein